MPSAETAAPAPQPVLLYDGECGLCSRLVALLLRLDSARRLRFSPLQGGPAQAFLRAHGLPTDDFDSLILVDDWNQPPPRPYQLRTDGALAAVARLPRPWRALAWLRVVPRPIRDALYRLVARWRHALFGAPRAADVPARHADRFL